MGLGGRAEPKILIVDDDPAVRDSLAMLFGEMRYQVETAEGADDALRAFARGRPDVILTDIFMQNGDGIELISRVRSLSRLTPIVAMSAERPGQGNMLQAAHALGADAVLAKGGPLSKVIETVDTCVGRI